MVRDAREILSEHQGNIEACGKTDSKRMQPFMGFYEASMEAGALDLKTKHLILVAIGVYTRCEHSIVEHTQEALQAGASREELIETAFLAGLMGGGPVVACSASILRSAINTFAPDYGK